MKNTITIFNRTGLSILLLIALFPLLGPLILDKTLTYGSGLGDLVYIAISIIAFLLFFILTNLKKVKSHQKTNLIIRFLMYGSILFFTYSFTFGRGAEYKWNGEVFHSTKSQTNE